VFKCAERLNEEKEKATVVMNCTPKVGHQSNFWGVFHGSLYLPIYYSNIERKIDLHS
jgi:hypothetical protein